MGETRDPLRPQPPDDFQPRPVDGRESPAKRGIVIRLPRALALLVVALLIVGALWLGSVLEGNFSGQPPSHLFGALLAFFAAVLFLLFAAAVRKKRAVGSWAPAAATVVKSEVVWGSGTKGGRTWLPLLVYEYAAGGRVYKGRRIAFYRRCTGHSAQELVARHPVGSRVQVYYDPAKPEEVVMDRSFRALWWLPVFAAVCAALAVLFFKMPNLLTR